MGVTIHSGHQGCRFRPRRQKEPGLLASSTGDMQPLDKHTDA
jgi:hypothetical protein